MRTKPVVLFVILAFMLPLVLIMPQPVSAIYGDISTASITSFNETTGDDVSFFADGSDLNTSLTFSHDCSAVAGVTYYSNVGLGAGDYGVSSDGDVLAVHIHPDALTDERVTYAMVPNGVSVSSHIEFRYRRVGACVASVYVDGTTGGGYALLDGTSTSWISVNAWVPSLGTMTGNVIRVRLICNDYPDSTNSTVPQVEFDYVRVWGGVYPAGWSHDCSAVANTSEGYMTSDGDTILIEGMSNGTFYIDGTATRAAVSPVWYPLLEMSVSLAEAPYKVWLSTAASQYIVFEESTIIGVRRANIRALTAAGVFNISVSVNYEPHPDVRVDYVKLYSIANFTMTQGGTTPVSHYLYVDSGVLYRVGSSVNQYWMTLDYDPAISIASTSYQVWNITCGNSNPTDRNDFVLQTYISPTWTTHGYDATCGAMPSGTTTDLRLTIYNANSFSAIKFLDTRTWNEAGVAELWFDMPNWHIVATAILAFWTAVNTLVLEGLFIVAGLILIPVSTLYLVHGGRDDLSNDKVFFFLVLFFVGWALFIGGIMP